MRAVPFAGAIACLFALGCNRFDSKLVGSWRNETKPIVIIDLKEDHTFTMQVPMNVNGTWSTQSGRVLFQVTTLEGHPLENLPREFGAQGEEIRDKFSKPGEGDFFNDRFMRFKSPMTEGRTVDLRNMNDH